MRCPFILFLKTFFSAPGLLVEHEELVADEVPDEREAGRHQFGDIGPQDGAQAEQRRDIGRDAGQDESVDDDADDADCEELGELDRFLLCLGLVLERPVLVHKVAVDDSDGERDAVEDEQLDAGRDAGEVDQDIEDKEIDAGVDAADDDEFGELLDEFREGILAGSCRERSGRQRFVVHTFLLGG